LQEQQAAEEAAAAAGAMMQVGNRLFISSRSLQRLHAKLRKT
jgi:hypothetical protein